MKIIHKKILILADIEGSSGCWDYEASSFLTKKWYEACIHMTLDLDAVIKALFNSGVEKIIVKDFHRTGYNIIPELLDQRAKVVHGYLDKPVIGIGDPEDCTAVMMIGLHASSGSNGFLAHALTSRLKRITVNGKNIAEFQLFTSSLAPYGIVPIFFSGCPVACNEIENKIKDITTLSIDKSSDQSNFNKATWRKNLAEAAVSSLSIKSSAPYLLEGPFEVVVEMNDQASVEKISKRWKFEYKKSEIIFNSKNFDELYYNLVKICYLTPFLEKILPISLFLFRILGYYGLRKVRRYYKKILLSLPLLREEDQQENL